MKKYSVAVVGATGAVGAELLKGLDERDFPIKELRLLASERSQGKKIEWRGKEYEVSETNIDSFKDMDIALFAGGSASTVFAKEAVKSGCVVIDNSSAFRYDPEVPLIVPEVNPEDAAWHNGIIANPNCSTIQMVVALKPLHDAAVIKRVVVSTYQAVSGAGIDGIKELREQTTQITRQESYKEFKDNARDAADIIADSDLADSIRTQAGKVAQSSAADNIREQMAKVAASKSVRELREQLIKLTQSDIARDIKEGLEKFGKSEVVNEMKENLAHLAKTDKIKPSCFPYQIAFNLLPQIDIFLENGYTKEEMKMVWETQKMLHLPKLPITATCVRVPIYRSHSEALNIETDRKLSADEARRLLAAAPGIIVIDNPAEKEYPMPAMIADTDAVYIGRIREDISCKKGLTFWVVADQLRKGAATNAIQIAELLVAKDLVKIPQ
ncbi:MAG: aspartate-semialdehyde dehydrogenase [Clostridia bacterium]|nr:aspartate-semialdehyde dehydrogenase [Clostridia bacterium]